jgi:pSer/pThr/pTyr-binding forkhead associated (FHA) protein
MQSQDDQPPGANDATLVAPRAQQTSARLILRRADGQLKEYGLDKDEISIGRLASNDVALPDDRSVSRRHAVIRRSNVGYVIEDQQSNNGTYVDGEKILYPFVLHNGQSIKVGSNELTFTIVSGAGKPAPAGAGNQSPSQPLPPEQPAAPGPFPSQSIPQPAFDAPPQPSFNAAPPIEQPQPAFPQPPSVPAFGAPPQPSGPAFQPSQPFGQPLAPEPQRFQAPPPFGAPPQPPAPSFQSAPGFQPPPAPAPSAGAGMITCQSCGQATMANKAFCLNCGASLVAQGASAAPPPAPGGASPFGAPPVAPAPGPGPQPWPPQPPQAQQPPPGPQPWPPQPQPQPWPGQSGQPNQFGAPPQPGQPNQFGPPPQPGQFGTLPQAPAPAAGPFDGTAFFPKGMRPLQTSDIRVRLATQFVAPGGLQPGTTITVRIWSAAQDAFYFSSPGITLRVPAPGAVEEGSLQVTPLRPTAPGATDQLLFMVVDANSGQPLHQAPIPSDVVISYQPAPPFDGPGSVRLPM